MSAWVKHLLTSMCTKRRRHAEGKGQPTLGSGCPSPQAIGLHHVVNDLEKSPKDLGGLRVNELVRSLAVSAAVMTAIVVMTPTALSMGGTAIVLVAVTRLAARGDVHLRPARCRSVNPARRAIRHRRRAANDGRQTTRPSHNHGRREWDRHPESEVHGPTRLRRGGEPGECNCGNKTEHIFCRHERFDGVFSGLFNG